MKQSKTLRRWELALLLGVACAALLGVWLDGAQAALSDQVIRLHVLANSDSEADQALKLRVRDRILAEAEELFVPGAGRAETEELLRAHLYDLAAAGAEVVGEAGYSYPVTASLVHDYWFPTKTYTDFALPAGAYTALRIEIGAGGGLVVRGVPAPMPGLRQRDHAGNRPGGRADGEPGLPDDRGGRGLRGEVQGRGAAGAVQGLAGRAIKSGLRKGAPP